MGIRFHCPNGHKLNVKAFLAGKRAICPKCGAKVLVPAVSENEEVLHDEAKPLGASAVLRQAPASAIGSAATVTPATPAAVTPATEAHPVAVQSVHVAVVADTPATSPAISTNVGANGAGAKDAIDEAPTAVWYVRPPTGGQYGPAAANVMRSWLAEGRVGATSLVWRAGWHEWRTAVDVFPQLSQGLIAGQPALPVGTPVSPTIASSPDSGINSLFGKIGATAGESTQLGLESGALSSRHRRKRRSQNVTIVASIVLVVVAIVLITVLIYVLNHQGASTEAMLRQTPVHAVEHGLAGECVGPSGLTSS